MEMTTFASNFLLDCLRPPIFGISPASALTFFRVHFVVLWKYLKQLWSKRNRGLSSQLLKIIFTYTTLLWYRCFTWISTCSYTVSYFSPHVLSWGWRVHYYICRRHCDLHLFEKVNQLNDECIFRGKTLKLNQYSRSMDNTIAVLCIEIFKLKTFRFVHCFWRI